MLHLTGVIIALIDSVRHVKLLLTRMKRQGIECVRIFSLLKKNFAKHPKMFHQVVSGANGFAQVFCL